MLQTWFAFVTFLGLSAAAPLTLSNGVVTDSESAMVTNFSANVTQEKVKNSKLINSEYEVIIPLNTTISNNGSEQLTLKLVREYEPVLPLPVSIISTPEVAVQTVPVKIVYEPTPTKISTLLSTITDSNSNNTEPIKNHNNNDKYNFSISTKLLPPKETSFYQQIDNNTTYFQQIENKNSTVNNTTKSMIVLETNFSTVSNPHDITKGEVQDEKHELNLTSTEISKSIQKYDVITTIDETNTYKNDNNSTYNRGDQNLPSYDDNNSNQTHTSENSSNVYNNSPAVSTIQPLDKLYTNAPVATVTSNVRATILSTEVELPRQFNKNMLTEIDLSNENEEKEKNTNNNNTTQELQHTVLKSCKPLEQKVPIANVISLFDNYASSDQQTVQVSLMPTNNLPNVYTKNKNVTLVSTEKFIKNSSNAYSEVLTTVDDLLDEIQKELKIIDSNVTETKSHKFKDIKNNNFDRTMTRDLIEQDYDEYDIDYLMNTTSFDTDLIVSTESTNLIEITTNNLLTSTIEGDIESNTSGFTTQTEEYYIYSTQINLPEPIVLSAELLKTDSIPTSDLLNVQNDSQEFQDISSTMRLLETENTSTNKYIENRDLITESGLVQEPDRTTELPYMTDLIYTERNKITSSDDNTSLQEQKPESSTDSKIESSSESALTTDLNYLEQDADSSIVTMKLKIISYDLANQQDSTTETYKPTANDNEIIEGNKIELKEEKVDSPLFNKINPSMQVTDYNYISGSVSNVLETTSTTNEDLSVTEQYIVKGSKDISEELYSTKLSTSDLENTPQYTNMPMLIEKENKLQFPITVTEVIINPTTNNAFKNEDLPVTVTEQYIAKESEEVSAELYSTKLSTSDLENTPQYTNMPMLIEKENRLQFPISVKETILNPTTSNTFTYKKPEPPSNPEKQIRAENNFRESSKQVKIQKQEISVNSPSRALNSRTPKPKSSHITNNSTRSHVNNLTFNKYSSVYLDIPVAVVYDEVKNKQSPPTSDSQTKITQYESRNIAKDKEMTNKSRLTNNKKRGSIKYSDTVTRSFYEAITSAPTVRRIKDNIKVSEITEKKYTNPSNNQLKLKTYPIENITGDVEPISRSHRHFNPENSLPKKQRGRTRYRNNAFISRDSVSGENGRIKSIDSQPLYEESVNVKSQHEIYKNEPNIKYSNLNIPKLLPNMLPFSVLSEKVNNENREGNLENNIKDRVIGSEVSGLQYSVKSHIQPLTQDFALTTKPSIPLVPSMFFSQKNVTKIDFSEAAIKTLDKEMQSVTTPSTITVRTSKNAGFINNIYEEHKLNKYENKTSGFLPVLSEAMNTNNDDKSKIRSTTENQHISKHKITKLPFSLDKNEVTTVSGVEETVDVKELRNEYIVGMRFINHKGNYFSSVYNDEAAEAKLKNKFNHEDKSNYTNITLEERADESKEKLSTDNASESVFSTSATNDDGFTINIITIQEDTKDILSIQASKVNETDSVQLEEVITLENYEILSTTPTSIAKPKRKRVPIRKIKRKVNVTSSHVLNYEGDRDDTSTRNTRSTNTSNEKNQKGARMRAPPVPIVSSDNRVYSHTGDFVYSYESGDGTQAFETGRLKKTDETHAGAAVQGGFSFKDTTGEEYSVEYTADEGGYRPRGAHLPTPPPVPPAIARALRYLATLSTPPPPGTTTASASRIQ